MNSESSQLSEIEKELIAFFVNAAQAFGLAKSVGEIYGLFFASAQPLALDEVVERLEISKGSASQGIRFLRSINALNSVYLPGDRRDHFTPETSLRLIAEGFLKERIIPQLNDGTHRLKEIRTENCDKCISDRIDSIYSWNRKASMIIPIATKFLGRK